jgi:hypothetical protein
MSMGRRNGLVVSHRLVRVSTNLAFGERFLTVCGFVYVHPRLGLPLFVNQVRHETANNLPSS